MERCMSILNWGHLFLNMKHSLRLLAFAWLWIQASKVENMDHMTGSWKASQGAMLGHVWRAGLGRRLMAKLLKCCCRFYELITAHTEHRPCYHNAVGQKVKDWTALHITLTHSSSPWPPKKHTFITESRCEGNGNDVHYYRKVTQVLHVIF